MRAIFHIYLHIITIIHHYAATIFVRTCESTVVAIVIDTCMGGIWSISRLVDNLVIITKIRINISRYYRTIIPYWNILPINKETISLSGLKHFRLTRLILEITTIIALIDYSSTILCSLTIIFLSRLRN